MFTTAQDLFTFDLYPIALPSLPRVDNQYNAHCVDHFHAGIMATSMLLFPMKNGHVVATGILDVDYYKNMRGFFIDQHPYSTWSNFHCRLWHTRGWQLVLGLHPVFRFGMLVNVGSKPCMKRNNGFSHKSIDLLPTLIPGRQTSGC